LQCIKLELNKKKKNSRKHANKWRLNNTLLNHQWIVVDISKEIKKFLEVNENENIPTRTYGTKQSQSYEESL
jgi:hypothetical protein